MRGSVPKDLRSDRCQRHLTQEMLMRLPVAYLLTTCAVCLLSLGIANAQNQATSQITIVKEVEPDALTDFYFTLSGPTAGGAQLDDDATAPNGNSQTAKSKYFAVLPGAYTITEQNPGPGWVFAGAKCIGAASHIVDLPSRTIKLKVSPSTKISCTIYNKREDLGSGKITIIKDALPDHVQDFRFRGTGPGGWVDAFALDDDLGVTAGNSPTPAAKAYTLPAGTYTFTEVPTAPGWTLSAIKCTPDTGTITDLANAKVTISLTSTSNVVCIFYNKK